MTNLADTTRRPSRRGTHRRSKRSEADQRALLRAHTTLTDAMLDAAMDGRRIACLALPGLYESLEHPQGGQPNLIRDTEAERDLVREQQCSRCPVLDKCLAYADLTRAQGIPVDGYLPHRTETTAAA